MINIKEGDFVMGMTKEGMIHGMVEHIMIEGGTLGTPGSEYSLASMPPDNPAMSVRIYEQEDGKWEETAYSIGMMYLDAKKLETLEGHMIDSETMMAMYDSSIGKAYEGCGCPTCKKLNVNCENCPVCKAEAMKSQMANAPYEDAEDMKSYYSDDEEMDKWDNIAKACWVGYEQQGMKEKDGRMVPNCVPVSKSEDLEKAKPNYEDMIEPRRGGSTPSNPRLYETVIREAKDRFDVYPSAVANAWVVGEYKRRGGTYKGEDMNKRDYSMDARRDMAASGMAMPDGSFPIANGGDLQNAIQSVGRASNYAAAKEHIVRRARALGMMDMLPEDWRNTATKGMGQWSGSIFDLNPFVK
jgi:hypothetical protein